MEAGMRSEQVYWVFTITVGQMDKFKPLVPKLVAATEKEPGALQFEFNIAIRRPSTSSNATRIRMRPCSTKRKASHNSRRRVLRCGQAHSLGDLWQAPGRVQEGERGLPPD